MPFLDWRVSNPYWICSPGRIQPANGHVIGMPHAKRPKAGAVVVEHGRAEDNLVPPIAIDVGGAQNMGALTAIARTVFAIVPAPQLAQLPVVELVGDDLDGVIGAAIDDQARGLAIEIGDAQLIPTIVVVIRKPFTRRPWCAGPRACKSPGSVSNTDARDPRWRWAA